MTSIELSDKYDTGNAFASAPSFSSTHTTTNNCPISYCPSSSSSSLSSYPALSVDEYKKIEMSLTRWLQDTKYKMTSDELKPFIKVANTSLLTGFGVGLVTNYALKRLMNRPIVPAWIPAILFGVYSTQVTLQYTRQKAYTQVLNLQGPLGDKARQTLFSLRQEISDASSESLSSTAFVFTETDHSSAPSQNYHSSFPSCEASTTDNMSSFELNGSSNSNANRDVWDLDSIEGRYSENSFSSDISSTPGSQREGGTKPYRSQYKTWDDIRREAKYS